jgi:major membrane immunogen (membrane-anchored lipoprotein)
MKRVIALVCSVVLCVGLLTAFTGCGKSDNTESTSDSQTTTEYNIEQDDNVVEDPF